MTTPLRQARERRNLTIQQVAAAVGIDSGNLSRIERGQQVPSKELTEKLAKYFGGEITELQIIYPERFAAGEESTGSESTAKPQE
jgi:transcriptional regulator with XRE-family HTH domain